MIEMKKVLGFILIAGLIFLTSCDLTKKYEKEEKESIMNYLNNHPDLTFTLRESGLYYMDVNVGDGEKPLVGDTVFVYYEGYYLDGYKFTSNVDKDPYVFPAGEGYVIPGFDEGILLIKEGGTAKMLIPSYLGYGNSGYFMPAYTPLLFDVRLDSIVPGIGKK